MTLERDSDDRTYAGCQVFEVASDAANGKKFEVHISDSSSCPDPSSCTASIGFVVVHLKVLNSTIQAIKGFIIVAVIAFILFCSQRLKTYARKNLLGARNKCYNDTPRIGKSLHNILEIKD